jgi:hypothetical protein
MSRVNYSIWTHFEALGESLSGIRPNYEKYRFTSIQQGPVEALAEMINVATIVIENIEKINLKDRKVFEEMMNLATALEDAKRGIGEMEERIRRAAHEGREE